MKQKWWLIISIIILLGLTYPFVFPSRGWSTLGGKNKQPQVIINGKTINVEIAKTDTERQKGLSGRTSLDANAGMLFIFPKADIWPFWMKDTKIPLDIIYINNNHIVDMTTLQPQNGDNIPQYTPQNKANYVLELNANSGFKVSDEVKINL